MKGREGGACGQPHVHAHEGRLIHQGRQTESGTVDRRQNGSHVLLAETAMPSPWPYLPLETLDYIVDLLHDESPALKECCLVSKSWIPRTRRHLFAHIRFYSADNLKSWKKTFPDPTIISTPCLLVPFCKSAPTLKSPARLLCSSRSHKFSTLSVPSPFLRT